MAAGVLSALMVLPAVGCRLCADGDPQAYAAYGGAWQRTRRDSGRVGSLFDPAGAKAPELVNRDQPPDVDAIQRDRRSGDQKMSPELVPDSPELAPDSPAEDAEKDPQDSAREPGEDEAKLQEGSLRDLQLEGIRHVPPPSDASEYH